MQGFWGVYLSNCYVCMLTTVGHGVHCPRFLPNGSHVSHVPFRKHRLQYDFSVI